MNNAPTYTRRRVSHQAGPLRRTRPASFTRAIAALGLESKAVFTCGGPCLPSSVAIATGRNLSGVAADMNAGGFQSDDVLDGVYLDRVHEGVGVIHARLQPLPRVSRANAQGRRRDGPYLRRDCGRRSPRRVHQGWRPLRHRRKVHAVPGQKNLRNFRLKVWRIKILSYLWVMKHKANTAEGKTDHSIFKRARRCPPRGSLRRTPTTNVHNWRPWR